MNILITASTPFELQLIQQHSFNNVFKIDFLVHGVGMVNTTYHLSSFLLKNKPNYIIQCGIAGAYNEGYQIGDVVFVTADQFADIGAEEANGNFIDWFELGLAEGNQFPFTEKQLINPSETIFGLPTAKGITVNGCSGTEKTINERQLRFNPDIETMEGAAFTYVCLQQQIKFAQIRAISNRVEPRNKEAWNIKLAVENYSNIICNQLHQLLPS